jgi:hypothetical protein
MRSRTRCAAALAAVAAASGMMAGGTRAGDANDAAKTAAAPAVARHAYLEGELEAAKSGDLYLVLDPQVPRLELRCEGVLLHSFTLSGARFAPPPRAAGPASWPAVAYQLAAGLGEPDRPLIAPPPPGGEETPPPPAEPPSSTGGIDFAAKQRAEVLHRAPAQYLLTFSPDLEINVLGVAGDGAAASPSLAQRLDEGWKRLHRWFAGSKLPPRVTLELPEDEARRLFLDLEPQIRLLVAVPPAAAQTG